MKSYLLEICYLCGSVTFIVGLRMMGKPTTARRGNLYGALGMVVAIFGTIFLFEKKDHAGNVDTAFVVPAMVYYLIFGAIALGTVIGWLTAKRVQMTKMPELVSMFNGMGGACAALIGLMEYQHNLDSTGALAAIIAGMVIGTVSFSGSVIAYLKLNGSMNKPIRLPQYNIINTIFMISLVIFGTWMVIAKPDNMAILYALFFAAGVYGILFTIPICGADMPVVISLLNSFTGLAAAFGGFLYDNKINLTGGILVGSEGKLLTLVM